jgi:2-amino-4-hydroxy-6-hydroxymethyldihydropteridine diphosphokinase
MHAHAIPVVLALGANLGDRIETIRRAIAMLTDTVLHDVRASAMYETEPVGYIDQPSFINMAVVGATTLSALELHHRCKAIELDLGRTPRAKWHEREIDIDVVFYGGSVVCEADLMIPHPRMHERRFVLQPCADIVPAMLHPVLHRRVDDLLRDCTDMAAVQRLTLDHSA